MTIDPRQVADAVDVRQMQAALLDWYGANARDLPWRRTSDPYAIWLSEAMLQQTRVETVIDYWTRFLARLPTVADLAAADADVVLALWSGLGYYRRARALHAAARAIVASGGEFSRERKDWLALPGVGPYTAGAVLSIAFGCSEPVVDGNVARVFARLFGLTAPLGSPELERDLWAHARRLVPAASESPKSVRGPGAWNQALMELGATICTSSAPACVKCPVASSCVALSTGEVAKLPRKAPKPPRVDVALEIAAVKRDDKWLLQRRPATGRMANMWELPTREIPPSGGEARLFPTAFSPVADEDGKLCGALSSDEPLGELRHGITVHRIRAVVCRAQVSSARTRPLRGVAPLVWVPEGELSNLALTGMAKKVFAGAFVP